MFYSNMYFLLRLHFKLDSIYSVDCRSKYLRIVIFNEHKNQKILNFRSNSRKQCVTI